MTDPAHIGGCLSCGRRTVGQELCDECWREGPNECTICGAEVEGATSDCLDHMDADELREEAKRMRTENIALRKSATELVRLLDETIAERRAFVDDIERTVFGGKPRTH